MPHTSRNKRQRPQHHKRREEALDDGWKRVTYDHPTKKGSWVTWQEPPVDPSFTLASLRKDYDNCVAKWQDSAAQTKLHAIVAQAYGVRSIDNAVCLALGSMSWTPSYRWRSMWQLVVFMDVVAYVESLSGTRPRLYAQEPRFSDLDIELLESFGFTVLPWVFKLEPALEYVTPSTFLYVPCLEWTSEQPYRARGEQCPLYMTSEMDWVLDEAERTKSDAEHTPEMFPSETNEVDQNIASARAIKKSHAEFCFPDFEHQDGIAPSAIYVKKAPEEEEEGEEH